MKETFENNLEEYI